MRTYPWGETPPSCAQAKTASCGDWTTVVAGSLSPAGDSVYGVSDMIGNAREWVADYLGPHPAAPQQDPTGPENGTLRITKGGSFTAPADAKGSRAAFRNGIEPWQHNAARGFRCVWSP
jgi:formylglycine-generating enzyme required for sulfatase activity